MFLFRQALSPYFGKHSEKLKSDLSVLFCKYFKDISFNFILVNSFKIDSFFSFKDRLPKGMRSSLIYKYSCVRCTSEYIGSTTRILTTRVAEHAGRSHRTDRIILPIVIFATTLKHAVPL